jgi:hypothetical protein
VTETGIPCSFSWLRTSRVVYLSVCLARWQG